MHQNRAATDVPRPEHPRPQLFRESWINLNGVWEFEIDGGDSGLERGLRNRSLRTSITVPFAPESEASGIGHVDFMEAVWYARTVTVPSEWDGRRLILHFGAVDHDATVWVNDVEVVRHRGGFSSFSADITDALERTDRTTARIVVRSRDSRHEPQARGKQATWYDNTHCNYTRTTGIWQTVWLEAVGDNYVRRLKITPNVAGRSVSVEAQLRQNRSGERLSVVMSDADGVVAERVIRADVDLNPVVNLDVPEDRLRLWSPEDPFLYDLRVTLLDQAGATVDTASSYVGVRSVSIEGKSFKINGRRIFQRLVLDQGYWPDTLMTAPTDEALRADIELAMRAGFNGARLHQKVFEERFLYHADRLGYLVWGEFGDWGVRGRGPTWDHQEPTASFITQWVEVLERDFNHPAIIGWCPMNETDQRRTDRVSVLDDVTRGMFLATKLTDPTRPVIDASGYSHRVRETDVYDSHLYEQDPAKLADLLAGLADDNPYVNGTHDPAGWSLPYAGQPYFVSEYGGIWWNPDAADVDGVDPTESWGYGQRVADEEEFYARFAGLAATLQANPDVFGYCYTQLTDVFQEQNGIYGFDRGHKLDVDRIRAAQVGQTAYEALDDRGQEPTSKE